MYLEDFREIVEYIDEKHKRQEEYFEKFQSLDSEFGYGFHNSYLIVSHEETTTFLLDKFLGEDLSNEVHEYVYRYTDDLSITYEDVTYHITDIDSFMDYINNVYKLPMKG